MNEPTSTTEDDFQRQTTSTGEETRFNEERRYYSITKHRSLFECCTCKNLVNPKTAKLMQCLHTICGTCFISVERINDFLTCQLCGNNSHSESVIDHDFLRSSFSLLEKCTSGVDNEIAEYKCADCNDLLCEECAKAHERVKLTKHHTLARLNQCTASEVYCTLHDDVVADHFCLSCSEVTCQRCSNERHGNHEMRTLRDHLVSLTQKSNRYSEILARDVKDIEKNIADLNAFENDFKDCLRLVLNEISRGCQGRRAPYQQMIQKAQTYFALNKQLECFIEAIVDCPNKLFMHKHIGTLRKAFSLCTEITNEMSKWKSENLKNENLLTDVKWKIQMRIKEIISMYFKKYADETPPTNVQINNQTTTASSARCKTPPARFGQSPHGVNNNNFFPIIDQQQGNFLLQQAFRQQFSNSANAGVYQQTPAAHCSAPYQRQSRGRGGRGGGGGSRGANSNANCLTGVPLQQSAQQQQLLPHLGNVCTGIANVTSGYGPPGVGPSSSSSTQPVSNCSVNGASGNSATIYRQNSTNSMQTQNFIWPSNCEIRYNDLGVAFLLDHARKTYCEWDPYANAPIGYPVSYLALDNQQRSIPYFLHQSGGQQVPRPILTTPPLPNSNAAPNLLTPHPNGNNIVYPQPSQAQRYTVPSLLAQTLAQSSLNNCRLPPNSSISNCPPTISSATRFPATVSAIVEPVRSLHAYSNSCQSALPSSNDDRRVQESGQSRPNEAEATKNPRKRVAATNKNGPSSKNRACEGNVVESNWSDLQVINLTPKLSPEDLNFQGYISGRDSSTTCMSAEDAINASFCNSVASGGDGDGEGDGGGGDGGGGGGGEIPLLHNSVVTYRETAVDSATVNQISHSIDGDRNEFRSAPSNDGARSALSPVTNGINDKSLIQAFAKEQMSAIDPKLNVTNNEANSATTSPATAALVDAITKPENNDVWDEDCSVCHGTEGEMLQCRAEGCFRRFHLDHHVPEYTKLPKKSFICGLCNTNFSELKTTEDDISFEKRHFITLFERKVAEHLLLKLFCHADSLPFHKVLDNFYEQFPQCRRMDLATIQEKLHNNEYESIRTFFNDVNQIFINYDVSHKDGSETLLLGNDYVGWVNDLLPIMAQFVQLKFIA